MTEKISEIQALGEIDSLLSQLNEDEISRIFNFITAKYKTTSSHPVKSLPQIQKNTQDVHIPSDVSIKDFLNIKKPIGFYERIACLGYYLEKMGGVDAFKTSDITQANKEARLQPMSNPTVFVNDATAKYGLLTPIGAGKKAVSAKGEALVEALPDRDRVKEVLEAYPTKRKPIKKAEKSNSE